jgi:hypothetical protein
VDPFSSKMPYTKAITGENPTMLTRLFHAMAVLLGSLLLPLPALADPQYFPTPALTRSIGVVDLRSPVRFYEAPSFQAPLAEELHWPNSQDALIQSLHHPTPMTAHDFFLSFVPNKGMAFLPAVDDTANGWVKVRLPHLPEQDAWLAPPAEGDSALVDWSSFMRLYAKKYGFNWLNGISTEMKSVYLRPEETAPLAKVTFVQGVRVLHVRGNWLLVELRDLGEERPIGWMRWRNESGDLLVWPNFAEQKSLFQSPSNPMNVQKMLDKY